MQKPIFFHFTSQIWEEVDDDLKAFYGQMIPLLSYNAPCICLIPELEQASCSTDFMFLAERLVSSVAIHIEGNCNLIPHISVVLDFTNLSKEDQENWRQRLLERFAELFSDVYPNFDGVGNSGCFIFQGRYLFIMFPVLEKRKAYLGTTRKSLLRYDAEFSKN